MAVEIEFANVIIRKPALDAKYPGGLDAFAATDLPNYIEDDNLVRVGFMSTGDAFELAGQLKQYGLAFDDTAQSEIAVGQHDSYPDWLSIGPVDDSMGCWLSGSEPGPLIRCTNGFLLRCSRNLFDRLESVLDSNGIVLVRSEPPAEDRDDYIQVIHFSRDNASITANVLDLAFRNGGVGLWASRDLSRRRNCADDIRIAVEIESVLLANGAENS